MEAEFLMDNTGRFRIRVGEDWSEWTPYSSVATLKVGMSQFIGVSAFFEGCLPIEQVLRVEPV